jgi:protein gp37
MPTTKISWTSEAVNFLTWNCHKVSPGCKHCYAETHSEKYPQNSAGGLFRGAPQLREKAFEELRLTPPGQTVFINTHSDTFHEDNPLGWIRRMFAVMNQRPDLIFLLLTKRPQVALAHAAHLNWGDNIWLGTSIENNAVLDRLGFWAQVPAAHRFLSIEPLLEALPDPRLPVAIEQQAEWVIVGGESGEYRRPFIKYWALDIQAMCQKYQVPFFFKQGSSIYPDQDRLLGRQIYDEQPAAFEQLRQRFAVQETQKPLF